MAGRGRARVSARCASASARPARASCSGCAGTASRCNARARPGAGAAPLPARAGGPCGALRGARARSAQRARPRPRAAGGAHARRPRRPRPNRPARHRAGRRLPGDPPGGPVGGGRMKACDRCLRRGALLATLVPWIARALDERRRLPAVLALPDDELIAAVCGRNRGEIDAWLARFDAGAARARGRRGGPLAPCAGTRTASRHACARVPTRCAALWLLGDAAMAGDARGGAAGGARGCAPRVRLRDRGGAQPRAASWRSPAFRS